MTPTNIKITQWNNELVKAGKVLLRILGILLAAYLAFFSYLAVHEWAGHILADELVDTRHGTTLARIEVIVQWFSVNLEDCRWSVELVPFRIGGQVSASCYIF